MRALTVACLHAIVCWSVAGEDVEVSADGTLVGNSAYDINDPDSDHTEHAIKLDEAGDMVGAIASFRAAASFDSEEGSAWFNLGTALCDEGNPNREADLVEARFALKQAFKYGGTQEAKEMYQTVSAELPQEKPGSRIGIVGEIRLTPVWHKPLKLWLLYHLEYMKFEHIILYVDINKQNRKNDTVCEVTWELAHNVRAELPVEVGAKVTLLDGGEVVRAASKIKPPDSGTRWELVWRQKVFVEDGFHRAEKMGLRWLLHIDVDEIFLLPPELVRQSDSESYPLPSEGLEVDEVTQRPRLYSSSLEEHFARLEAMVTYYNLEAVCEDRREQIETQNYFVDLTLFKKHVAMHSLEEGRTLREHQKHGYGNHYKWYQGYGQGKSAARVGACDNYGVHSMELSKASALRHVSSHEHFDSGRHPSDRGPRVYTPGLPLGYVVHFINAGYDFWKTKYEILGVFSDGYFGNENWQIPFIRHLESRDALMHDKAREFYLSDVVMDDDEAKRLEQAGFLFRSRMIRDIIVSLEEKYS